MRNSRQSSDTLSFASDMDDQSPDPALFYKHDDNMGWMDSPPSGQRIDDLVRLRRSSGPDIQRQIEEYRAQTNRRGSNYPTNDEYALVLSFAKSCQREVINHSRSLRTPASAARNVSKSKLSTPAPLKNLVSNGSRVQKRRATRDAKPAVARSHKRSANQAASINASDEGAKPSRAKSTKPRNDENYKDFQAFPPPTSMKNPEKAAHQVRDFPGSSNDLSDDPEYHLLEPAELIVAKKLSLTCAKYLLTRGQIIRGHVELLTAGKKGENWNKTAAQKVCNIDVNKASCLFQFFKDIDWFEKKHYKHLLPPSEE